MERVPAVMATQHPDSARKYVPVQKEVDEALLSFLDGKDEGVSFDEYKVDYEGKLTPYHQVSQIVSKLVAHGLKPGSEVFVTPRMPSAREETVFRQTMVMMAAIEANYVVQEELGKPAVIEVINPMTKDPSELVAARRRLDGLIELARREMGVKLSPSDMAIIPLLEAIEELFTADELVSRYLAEVGAPHRLRVFLGRSDPALRSGFIAATLAVKVAMSKLYAISEKTGIPVYPILGVGCLPFRGHLTPDNAPNVIKEYSGVRTVTVQSGLRYDHPKEKVRETVALLKRELPKSEPLKLSGREVEAMRKIAGKLERPYAEELREAARVIVLVSDMIPSQRDRLPPIGPLAYGRREIAELTFPRVIKVTAAFYTIGLPPEFLGLSGLKELEPSERELLLELYPSLPGDLLYAAKFLNLKVAGQFVGPLARRVERGVEVAERVLGIDIYAQADEAYQSLLALAERYVALLLKSPSRQQLTAARRVFRQLGVMRGSLG